MAAFLLCVHKMKTKISLPAFLLGHLCHREASLVAQMVKSLPAMWETWVQSLFWEDPLEKERATDSSIRAWRIPWTEEPGTLYSPWDHKGLDTTE